MDCDVRPGKPVMQPASSTLVRVEMTGCPSAACPEATTSAFLVDAGKKAGWTALASWSMTASDSAEEGGASKEFESDRCQRLWGPLRVP